MQSPSHKLKRARPSRRAVVVVICALLAAAAAGSALTARGDPTTRPTVSLHRCGGLEGARWRLPGQAGDRWSAVATRRGDCRLALKTLRLVAGGRAHDRRSILSGGPRGWRCYASAVSGRDARPIAGVCRAPQARRFIAWYPPPPRTAEEHEDEE